jgi:hypothetical protein
VTLLPLNTIAPAPPSRSHAIDLKSRRRPGEYCRSARWPIVTPSIVRQLLLPSSMVLHHMTTECNSCGAKILASTYQRTGSLCKPCWKDRRRKRIGETPFGKAYDNYFRQPGRLAEKYFNCWIELELTIAGPLFSAREEGNVRYVFRKNAIAGVENFDDLIAWMKGQFARFRNRVCEIEPVTPDDTRSRDVLLSRVAELEVLISLWPEFDKEFSH